MNVEGNELVLNALRNVRDIDSKMLKAEGELTEKINKSVEDALSEAEGVLEAFKESHKEFWAFNDLQNAKEKLFEEYERLVYLNDQYEAYLEQQTEEEEFNEEHVPEQEAISIVEEMILKNYPKAVYGGYEKQHKLIDEGYRKKCYATVQRMAGIVDYLVFGYISKDEKVWKHTTGVRT